MAADNRVHRLEDLLVEEVSIVDKPANKRRFLTVKSEGDMAKGPEIRTDTAGNLVTDPAAPPPGGDPAPDLALTPELAEKFTAVGKGLVEVEKRLSIDPEMRRGIFRELGDAMGRLQSVLAAADVARIDRGEGGSTLVPVLGTELGEIAKVLGGMARKLTGSGTKKADVTPAAPDKGAALLEELVTTVETAVAKRGAKMGKGRLAKFREAMKVLSGILTELDNAAAGPGAGAGGGPPGARPPGAPPFPPRGKAKKSDDGGTDPELLGLVATVGKLTGIVKSQGAVIHELRTRPGSSNVLPVDSSPETVTKSDDEVNWPLDMNDEKTPETVEKAVSFL